MHTPLITMLVVGLGLAFILGAVANRLKLSVGTLRTAMSRAQARYLAQVRQLAPEFFPDRA